MEFNDITYDVRKGAAWITINREKVMNAFRADTVEEMTQAAPLRTV